MMFAMEDRRVALEIVVDLVEAGWGSGLRVGHGFPRPIAYPGTLFLTGILDIEEAQGLAVLL